MLGDIFTVTLILLAILFIIGLGVWRWSERHEDKGVTLTIGAGVVAFLLGNTLYQCSGQIAGQGNALAAAQAWAAQNRPGGSVSCMTHDTDDDKYVTCTVAWRSQTHDQADDLPALETIRCGVDRWFHGWQVRGCQLLIPTRGTTITVGGGGTGTRR